MVVVRCLILCSKFAKIGCWPGSAQARWGAYSAPPGPLVGSWGREGKRDGRTGGEGKGMKGQGEGGEGNEGEISSPFFPFPGE